MLDLSGKEFSDAGGDSVGESAEEDFASVSSQDNDSNSMNSNSGDLVSLAADQISVPIDDMESLEWLSQIVDDSVPEIPIVYPAKTAEEQPERAAVNRFEPAARFSARSFTVLGLAYPVPTKCRSEGSSSSSGAFSSSVKPEAYTNYRRLKEQTESDYIELKTFSSRTSNLKEIRLCGKEREDYVPCYNVSANLLAGFKDGEEFDRHCEVSQDQPYCLVRPPRDYKTPLSWPAGRDVIWNANVKMSDDRFLSTGSMTKRLMMLEENQISFDSDHELIFDGVKDHSRQVAEIIGLGSDAEFWQAGVRMVLDIGCGFGSFGAHLLSLKVMTVCMAAYESTGSQVQLSLERGLPAVIGSLISRKLPFPSLSYDMIHCAQCGVSWDQKDGLFLVEANRILKPGGYFVLHETSLSTKTGSVIEGFTRKICWTLIGQQQETFIWQKTTGPQCYSSSTQGVIPPCREDHEDIHSYYQPLTSCVAGTASKRWVPVQNKSSDSHITPAELEIHGKSSAG
ncbi:hypothetical protein SSX86_028814 [Deinandra increscens subsp. villosa]|uniref:Methyltransferase n=1 Tax=Deinandra increscens subsp. villosa TaxID=3103831 RepID=A0AAP0GK07_9ASTR